MSKKNNPKSTGQEIFVEGYIIHGGKTSELNKRLETTVTILSRLSPDETRPEGLEYVAAALIDDTLLNSKNQVSKTLVWIPQKRRKKERYSAIFLRIILVKDYFGNKARYF
jgi:hypothetical protein